MNVTTKFGQREIVESSLKIILSSESGFPIIVRYIGTGDDSWGLVRGNILMWHWETAIYFIYSSLDTAMRGCVHIKIKYGRGDQRADSKGELAQLSEIIQRHGMLWNLIGNWRGLSLAERRAYTEASLATFKALRWSRNRLRLEIARRSKMASDIIDSRGRPNKSRTDCLQATVVFDAKRRVVDVRSITVYVDRRQSALFDQNERNLDLLRRVTAEVACLISFTKYQDIVDSLRRLETMFSEIKDAPYTHLFRRCLEDDLRPALISIDSGSRRDVTRRVRRMSDAIEVFWLSRELVELRLRLAFALSHRPHRQIELNALRFEFEDLLVRMKSVRDNGLDKNLRNRPLPRAIRYLTIALLEWTRGQFKEMTDRLDDAEKVF